MVALFHEPSVIWWRAGLHNTETQEVTASTLSLLIFFLSFSHYSFSRNEKYVHYFRKKGSIERKESGSENKFPLLYCIKDKRNWKNLIFYSYIFLRNCYSKYIVSPIVMWMHHVACFLLAFCHSVETIIFVPNLNAPDVLARFRMRCNGIHRQALDKWVWNGFLQQNWKDKRLQQCKKAKWFVLEWFENKTFHENNDKIGMAPPIDEVYGKSVHFRATLIDAHKPYVLLFNNGCKCA